jgi:hypothetical protein
MATLHPQMRYYAGDTIMFDVICKDADGVPVNLSGIDIEFMLNDPYGGRVESYSIVGAVTTGGLEVLDMAGGKIGVTVAALRTVDYIAGYYRDHLRLSVPEPGFDNVVISELVGHILIKPAPSAVVALHAGSLSVQPPE